MKKILLQLLYCIAIALPLKGQNFTVLMSVQSEEIEKINGKISFGFELLGLKLKLQPSLQSR